MKKRKKKLVTNVKYERLYRETAAGPVRRSDFSILLSRRTQAFLRDEPGLFVRTPKTPHVPQPQKHKDRIARNFVGFQKETRVTSCDTKRERRRRAYFGYTNGPHAGKGAGKKTRELSPHGDRFTVKC